MTTFLAPPDDAFGKDSKMWTHFIVAARICGKNRWHFAHCMVGHSGHDQDVARLRFQGQNLLRDKSETIRFMNP